MSLRLSLLAALALLFPLARAGADVRIVTGRTPIPAGNARAAGDLTVVNERLAFALAVESPAPYGVPRGAIVDVAPVSDGQIGRDRVVFADFIPNNWSAWPNTYQHVEVLDRGPHEVRIRAVRDWGKARIDTTYTLREQSDRVEITTTMTNEGDVELPGLLSGLTLWPSSGFLFSVPGLAGVTEGAATAALANRVSAYDSGWTITLHAPYLDHIGSNSRDMFLQHSLKPKESRTFTGWLQVGATGDLAPAIAAEVEARRLPAGSVHGTVRSAAGKALAEPVVVVEKDGKPYGWTLGRAGSYSMTLPAGSYTLYATGRNYSRSGVVPLKVADGSTLERDFSDLQEPGRIEFAIVDARNAAPLDARIGIVAGDKPVVEFLGRKTFFSELERKGRASVPIAPGRYRFAVSAGAGFLAQDALVDVSVEAGHTVDSRVPVGVLFEPRLHGWYSADLHHHADQAEAVTPPADLARSQLAAGLDLLFVSDHDSTTNHEPLSQIARDRHVPFIPGIELSPSWGHFNAYPLAAGSRLTVDTSTASVEQVLAEARRMGAAVVQVNHPFIPFGYLTSVANKVAPGGMNEGFDVLEFNSSQAQDDERVFAKLGEYWNARTQHYLAGGSDTHDVWNEQSGRIRTFAHVDGAISAQAFARSVKEGHAYVTYGPLVFPAVMFGSTLRVKSGEPFSLGFDLAAVSGLRRAELVGGDGTRQDHRFEGAPMKAHADFSQRADHPTWYALVVEDASGRKAYTDPVWVDLSPAVPPSENHH
ncbi:MAG: CehA/McbA family metallohydrolase [Proteobacteria bacterium]|nr:CehA/McbA family metallohydrolase [Pseudomonadota bacterium]